MNILQSPQWQQLKTQFGWFGRTINLNNTNISILYRRLPLGFNIAYIPKGPAINWQKEALVTETINKIIKTARQKKTIFLKIEPDTEAVDTLQKQFEQANFKTAKTIQPPTTIVINISRTEDEILATMKSKTRYNIRLASKKGIKIKQGGVEDLATFHQLSEITTARDGFAGHPLAYYQAAFKAFAPEERLLLLASYEGQSLAGLIAFAYDGQACYLYGASNNQHRNRMPTYLLQWEAIKWAKAQGCHSYDLWGIPTTSVEQLEAEFTSRHDGLWGVYRFKRGFGGKIVHSVGAFDYIYNRPLYLLINKLMERRAS